MKKPKYRPLSKARFDKLTVYQQRVAIMKDIILRIDLSILIPFRGSFIHDDELPHATTSTDLQCEFNKVRNCEACAKGALAMAWIGNFNKYMVEDFGLDGRQDTGEKGTKELVACFGRDLFDAIEIGFEGWVAEWHAKKFRGKDSSEDPTRLSEKIIREFGRSFDTQASHALRAIAKNIIKNKGVMVLADGTVIGA
jgi:hypothetical protein